MRRRSILASTVISLMLLAGCASQSVGAGVTPDAPITQTAGPSEGTVPAAPKGPDMTVKSTEAPDLAAQQQAQEWLDAAAVPPGAVVVTESPGPFNSHQGWVCQPVATLVRFWTLADSTVAAAINWLRENPPAGLISTSGGPPIEEEPDYSEGMVGFIPADDSQEGIVYTVIK